MRLSRIGVNFYKVVVGVGFSLLWARAMYAIWSAPSFTTFIWFYLVTGSVILKWIFFEVIDRIHLKLRLGAARTELEASDRRVREVAHLSAPEVERRMEAENVTEIALGSKLRQLEDGIVAFGQRVGTALEQSLESVDKGDIELAKRVIAADAKLDQYRLDTEMECMGLIATGQLRDGDLRRVIAIINIATELERMGDYAKGIGNIVLMIGEHPQVKLLEEISHMAAKGKEMLRGSLEAFWEADADKAKRIFALDDEVDTLHNQAFRGLILFAISQPNMVTQATRLTWIAHNLERFADRVTNICERVVFSVTGELDDTFVSKH